MRYSFFFTVSLLLATTNALAEAGGSIPHPVVPSGSIGIFNAGVWALDVDRTKSWTPPNNGVGGDEVHYFGQAGDKPVVMYAPPCFSTQTAGIAVTRGNDWYASYNNLDYGWDDDPNAFVFGSAPFAPVTWGGTAVTFSNGNFLIDWNGNHEHDGGDANIQFGSPGQIPVIGVWATTSGGARVGTFDPVTHKWYVDANGTNTWSGTGTGNDKIWTFGIDSSDYPVVMPYSDGVDHIGVFNGGVWYMDYNGNHVWDGEAGGDTKWYFGSPGDTPVVVRTNWNGACPID
jgi:hypothetical protein